MGRGPQKQSTDIANEFNDFFFVVVNFASKFKKSLYNVDSNHNKFERGL